MLGKLCLSYYRTGVTHQVWTKHVKHNTHQTNSPRNLICFWHGKPTSGRDKGIKGLVCKLQDCNGSVDWRRALLTECQGHDFAAKK
eukprot:1146357-Pelagomonas_calceolata.AAC.8